MVDSQRTREVHSTLPPRPALAPVSRQGSVLDSDAPVKMSRRRKAAVERGRGGARAPGPVAPPTAGSSNLPPLANRFHSRPRSQSKSRSRSRSPPYHPRGPLSRRLASPHRRFRRSPSSRYGTPRPWSPPPRRFNSPPARYRRRRSYSPRARSPLRPARSRSPVRRGRSRSRSPLITQDTRSDTLATATTANPTSSIPTGSPRPSSNQEGGPASKPETEESETSRKEQLRVRLQKERELAMVPQDPFERLEVENRQRQASLASRMQSKASDVGSKVIQKKTDGEGNHHRHVSETAARADRERNKREEADGNKQQASKQALSQLRGHGNLPSDAGREVPRRTEEQEQTLLQSQRQRVATEVTRSSAADAQKYDKVVDDLKREAVKKREETFKQRRDGEQVSIAKQVEGSKTAVKAPTDMSDMELDSDEEGKGKVSGKVKRPVDDDDDDANDAVMLPKKEEDDEEDEIEIVEYKPKKEQSDQEEDDIVIVEPNDVGVAAGLPNPLKRKKEEDSDDEDKPLRKQRITGPRNFEQLNQALRREPFPPRRDLLQARREPFPPRPVVSLPARQPPIPPRRFPARIFQVGRQPAAQGTANGQANGQTPSQPPQAPAPVVAPVAAPAQPRPQQNARAAPLNQEQWLQRIRGQEVEPRNGAVRAAVLNLVNQRDVINAQLKGLYEEFGREGR